MEVSPSHGLRVQVMGDVQLQPGDGFTLRGYYRDGKIYPEMIHRHRRGLRNLFSYTALLILFDVPRRLRAWKVTRF